MTEVYLRSVGCHVPDHHYTNADLCELLGFPAEKGERYEKLIGVRSRPVCVDYAAGGRQIVSGEDLACGAAREALRRAERTPADIDMVIACSSFFDYVAPPISSRLLKRLGLEEAVTFDLIGGCAEFLHGIQVAANAIRLGQAAEVLVVSSEVINAWWRQTRYPLEFFVFGDTGGAVVLSRAGGSHRIRRVHLATKASILDEPAELICVPILGGKEPVELFYDDGKVDELLEKVSDIPARQRLVHNIKQVALGAPSAMVESTRRTLEDEGVDPTAVFLVPHQASINVLKQLDATGVPTDQIGISLPLRGNMSTSSVPVTLAEHWDAAVRHPYLCLTSVGVGMSHGAVLLERVDENVPAA